MKEQQGLLLFMTDVDPKREDEFNRWYEEEHVPERLAILGFHRARRYRVVHGAPKYLALYDVANTEVFSSPRYLEYYSGPKETAWTRDILAACRNMTRNIYTKISDKSSGSMQEQQGLLLFMTDIDPKREDDFNRWYEEEHVPERLAIPGFHRARRYRVVHGAPKYLALYDVTNIEVFSSPGYLEYYSGPKGDGTDSGPKETAWTREILAACRNMTRNIYTKISDKYSDQMD